MKYGFFEKVKIVSSKSFPTAVGKIGIVIGISEEDEKIYGYAVTLSGSDEGIFFVPEELQGTGEFVDRATIYDENDRIKIRVNRGEGKIL